MFTSGGPGRGPRAFLESQYWIWREQPQSAAILLASPCTSLSLLLLILLFLLE